MANNDKGFSKNIFFPGGGEVGRLMRMRDWGKTGLGDVNTWPQSLRTMVNVCLNSKFPMIIWWGPDFIKIYNDPYCDVIESKHPQALGAKGIEVWPEVWDVIGPMLESVYYEGKSTWSENLLTLLNRKGYQEESYFTFSHSPIYDESGKIGGVFTAVNETTEAVINERRLTTLLDISRNIFDDKTEEDVYKNVLSVLKDNPYDFPFSIIYQIDEDGKKARYAGASEALPYNTLGKVMDLENAPNASAKYLHKCVEKNEPVFVNNLLERFGDVSVGPWDIPPTEGVAFPVKYGNRKYPVAILIATLNPYQKLNGKYKAFLQLVIDQIETAISNVLALEEERKIERARMHTEAQLKNLFMQAPIAICLVRGPKLIFEVANDKMLELLGKTDAIMNKPVFEAMPDAAGQGFEQILGKVYTTGERIVAEEAPVTLLRNGIMEPIIVKYIFEPLKNEAGTVTGIMALADEITEQVNIRRKIEESEKRLKNAIETAQLGTFGWQLPATELDYSERFANIFGFPKTYKITPEDFRDAFHPDDLAIRKAAENEVTRTGNLNYEVRIIWKKDGSVHWIRVNAKIIYSRENKPVWLYGTVMDITDQKNLSEQLKEKVKRRTLALQNKNKELARSEEKYHKMVEEVQDYAIILLSKEGTILNWNKGAEKIKGYTEEEVLGKNFKLFYLPEDLENNIPEKLLSEAIEKGKAAHEGWRVRKDGAFFWCNTIITTLYDDKKKVLGFSKVTRDLTERKQAEDKLKQYTLELEMQNKELEQFAYVASHDLQEPLRKIQVFSQLMQQKIPVTEETRRYFEKINSSSQRMAELIKSILNYSRLSTENEGFVKTDLNEILEGVKTDFELLIAEKKVKITSDKLPVINGVPLQLSQLFSNLISNSIKFSDKKPIIKISNRRMTAKDLENYPFLDNSLKYVELQFTDNGIGFEQEYAEKIFVVFQRLHEKQTYSGTGVGLALCKKIVENHQGAIRAVSELGKGSTFFICLPLNLDEEYMPHLPRQK